MAKPRKKAPRKKARKSKITKKPRAARQPKAKRRTTRAKKSASASRARQRPRKKRTLAPKRRLTRARAAAPRAPLASVTEIAAETGLAAGVAAALRGRGHSPDPEAVEAIAAVCAGYRKGPGADSPLAIPFDADLEVAREFVDRFLKGVPRAVLDREMHRGTVRSTVDGDLEQFGFTDVGEPARATLTSLCLGAWEPGADEHAKRNAIAGFVVRWYRAGLT